MLKSYSTNSVLASKIFIIKVFHSKELCNSIKLVGIFQYTVWCSCFHLVLSLSVLSIEARTWFIHLYNLFWLKALLRPPFHWDWKWQPLWCPLRCCLTQSASFFPSCPCYCTLATPLPSCSASWDCVLAAFTPPSPSQSGWPSPSVSIIESCQPQILHYPLYAQRFLQHLPSNLQHAMDYVFFHCLSPHVRRKSKYVASVWSVLSICSTQDRQLSCTRSSLLYRSPGDRLWYFSLVLATAITKVAEFAWHTPQSTSW